MGGNTSCVEVRFGDQVLILDGGTGLRGLGSLLLSEPQPTTANVLFSHVHWDHIQGIPFFTPLFQESTTVRFHGLQQEGALEASLRTQMQPPNFPVRLEDVPAALSFHAIPDDQFEIGSLSIRAAALNHPGGVLAYRIEAGGNSVVYATDTEHVPGQLDTGLVDLASNADILIYDSQYTDEEYDGKVGPCRHGWGHSTWTEGVRIATEARVGKLILFHHDPTHTDIMVDEIEAQAQCEFPRSIAAREGLVLTLDSAADIRAA